MYEDNLIGIINEIKVHVVSLAHVHVNIKLSLWLGKQGEQKGETFSHSGSNT
jgi:hypothetical protein